MSAASFNFPDPCVIEVPKVSALTPPNLFPPKSTCLLDRIIEHGAGLPKKCVFVKKSIAHTGSLGWECRYTGTFRPFLLPTIKPQVKSVNQKGSVCRAPIIHTSASNEHTSDDSEGESVVDSDVSSQSSKAKTVRNVDTDDERAGDIAFWFSDGETEKIKMKKRTKDRNPGLLHISSRPRLLSNQHDFIFDKLVQVVDQTKYALLVNALG